MRERYVVRFDEGLMTRTGYLAGDDARREAELLAALDDPTVDAIVAARGGYGATRILDRIPIERVARSPKLLVGFSDVTALHALWQRAGVRSMHASMIAGLGRASDAHVARFVRALEGEAAAPLSGLSTVAEGEAEGPLVGGNLSVLAALVGTPYAPPVDGAVLLLEDVGERPYRVDRMLTTLAHAGWLSRVAGVALGAFTGSPPGDDGTRIEDVLRERLSYLPVPVVAGVPAGHVDDNVALPLGARVRLDAANGTLQFLEGAVRLS